MNILESSEHLFKRAGIIPFDSNRLSVYKSFVIYIFGIILVGPILYCLASLYIYHHLDEMDKSANAVMVISSGTLCCGKYTFLKYNCNKIKELISDFQKMFDEGRQYVF